MSKIIENLKFLFDVLLIVGLYIGGIFTLQSEIIYIAVIVGSSVSGAVVLAYFKRDRDHKEIFFKSACAALCGLVTGAVVAKRWEIESIEYLISVYFFASLLSLFFIKGLLAVTEQNASGLILTVIQRIFNAQNLGKNLELQPEQIIKTEVIVKKDNEPEIVTREIIEQKKE